MGRATQSTNKKKERGEKQILVGPRVRRRCLRVQSGNKKTAGV
jgi:hypothetical protein